MKFAKSIGANTDFLTSQTFVIPFEEDQSEVFLIALISASGEDVFNKVRQSGGFILEKFLEVEGVVSLRLDEVYKFLAVELSFFDNLQILLGFIHKGTLYTKSWGLHTIYLLRDGKLANLIVGQTGNLISGYLKSGDKLLFITSKNIDLEEEQIVWDESVINQFIKVDQAVLNEELENFLVQYNVATPIGVVLMEFVEKEVEEFKSLNENHLFLGKTKRRLNFEIFKTIFFICLIRFLNFFRNLRGVIFKNRKTKVIFVGLVFMTVILGVSFILSSKNSIESQNNVNKLLVSATKFHQEALNSKDSDTKLAKENLDKAREDVKKLLMKEPNNKKAQDLEEKIRQDSGQILKIFEIKDWPVFLSLDLIKKDFLAEDFSYSLGKILMLDRKQKSLVVVDLAKKTNQLLAGGQVLGDVYYASLNSQTALAFSRDKGVIRVDLLDEKPMTAVKLDSEWGDISDIYGFGGNIYLLDSIKSQIWKYVAIESGYSDKTIYLKGSYNLNNSKQLVIDYSVWVLKDDAEILKFTGGVEDFFSFSGLDEPISEVKSFFVTEEEDSVYLLEPKKSRIVVLKKNGQYLYQYKGDQIAKGLDLAVDEKNKKLYLLSDRKIFQIDLR